jgi:hypothetical protein
MTKAAVLNGETVVCQHTKRWVHTAGVVLGLTEAEVIERMLNGYVHQWHVQFEVPLNSTGPYLALAIRNCANGGGDVR